MDTKNLHRHCNHRHVNRVHPLLAGSLLAGSPVVDSPVVDCPVVDSPVDFPAIKIAVCSVCQYSRVTTRDTEICKKFMHGPTANAALTVVGTVKRHRNSINIGTYKQRVTIARHAGKETDTDIMKADKQTDRPTDQQTDPLTGMQPHQSRQAETRKQTKKEKNKWYTCTSNYVLCFTEMSRKVITVKKTHEDVGGGPPVPDKRFF